MAELFDSVKAFQDDSDCMAALAQSCGIDGESIARDAFGLAVPIAIDGLVATSSTKTGAKGLLRTARGLRWSERVDPKSLFSELDESMSQMLTRQVLGGDAEERAAELAAGAGISESSAHGVIETTMALSLASVTGVSGQDLSLERLTSLIGGEDAGPLDRGESASPATENAAAEPAVEKKPKEVEEAKSVPTPVVDDQVAESMSANEGSGPNKGLLIGAGVAALVVVGLGALLLGGGGDDGSETETATPTTVLEEAATDSDGDAADANAAGTDGDGPDDADADADADDEVSGLTPVDTDDSASGIVSLSIPMTDITGTNAEAAGTLDFDFDTATGEVCYTIEATGLDGPYRSHIHVGGADVQGGIVVDLGALDNGATGCVDNRLVDTAAILADPAGHYAELHDASEDFTIRGQLSEAMADDDESADEASTADDAVDTDGGGARTVLRGGVVYLEGEVSDQATADELLDQLSGLDSSTTIVNDLTVASGAPLPSGRVVIADAIFFDSDSDAVKAVDQESLDAIVALAESRDDLVLTIVGHTDSQGDDVYNLELSLRRAAAVRDLLVAEGLAGGEILTRGAGETAPIGDNGTNEGRAENRRIEFEFATS